MESLIQDIQKTILALEKLSQSSQGDVEQIDELLDQLFQQKIDLMHVSLNVASPSFHHAAEAMRQSAVKLGKQPINIQESIAQVHQAVGKLAKLLDQALPIV